MAMAPSLLVAMAVPNWLPQKEVIGALLESRVVAVPPLPRIGFSSAWATPVPQADERLT